MYRPDNWEEIKTEAIGSSRGAECIPYQSDLFFEDGADAMYEAVIQFLEQEIVGHAQFLDYWLIPKKHWNKLKG